ncbi:MAG: hypothetical protein COV43_05245 [Deltaproteobacteria bacterium CG11_big_fil_rev_8_21_14_0_20_42_23]|nr:MAG: hypothetical protein COV43_05245 [Deltaproteobacteria bacterium CG11_big_fil_rev_8_21_14_0_20_42_23]PJC63999.1 MAG: hypothetical protein CO021_06210 [Deltaproteobacteria bacterium CG_4_9_14_0_2_um_filter_42_21]
MLQPLTPQLVVLSPSLGASSVGPYHSKLTSMANAAALKGAGTTLVLPKGERPQLPGSIRVLQVPNVFNHRHVQQALEGSNVRHVLPLREACVETAASLSGALNLVGISPDSAKLARDKFLMKQAARKQGLATADFTDLTRNYTDLYNFAREYDFHIVLKPRTGFGCIGTKVINKRSELLKAWYEIQGKSQHYIAEAFVNAAAEYHVDLLFRGGENLFVELCRYPEPLLNAAFPGNMTCHYARTPQEETMIAYGIKMLRALQVQNKTGVAHIEFFLTPDQRILFGEAALRLPGGSIVPLYKAFTGIDLAEAWVLALFDGDYKPNPIYRDNDIGTELLAAPHAGTVTATPPSELSGLEGLLSHELWVVPGDTTHAPEGSTGSRIGHYIYANNLPPFALERRRGEIRDALTKGVEIQAQ